MCDRSENVAETDYKNDHTRRSLRGKFNLASTIVGRRGPRRAGVSRVCACLGHRKHKNEKPLPIDNLNDTSEEHMAGRVQAGVTAVQSHIPYRSFGRSVRIFRNSRS